MFFKKFTIEERASSPAQRNFSTLSSSPISWGRRQIFGIKPSKLNMYVASSYTVQKIVHKIYWFLENLLVLSVVINIVTKRTSNYLIIYEVKQWFTSNNAHFIMSHLIQQDLYNTKKTSCKQWPVIQYLIVISTVCIKNQFKRYPFKTFNRFKSEKIIIASQVNYSNLHTPQRGQRFWLRSVFISFVLVPLTQKGLPPLWKGNKAAEYCQFASQQESETEVLQVCNIIQGFLAAP